MFKSLLARAREARATELEGEGGLDAGFTLIELMVVLLIIAILLAIAIPTFLGVTGSAKDRSAQSSLTNALTNAVAYYQNAQTFDQTQNNTACSELATGTGCSATTTTASGLAAQETSYNWVAAGTACTTGNNKPCVSVAPVDVATANDGQGIILATYSNTGTCWYVANLQATPAAIGASNAAVPYSFVTAGNAPTDNGGAITKAGTYFAEKTNVGSSNCNAGYAATQGAFKWYDSFGQVTLTN
ncbi:MAG: prepilin-type N-terminal cleavage/methylation domain-containing protein [Acidimicrobiales bacterium]